MSTYIMPYKLGSASAKALAQSLNVLRVDGSKRFRRGTTIINWGKSDTYPRSRFPIRVLNKPEAVRIASNKLSTFQRLATMGIPTVQFTTDKNIATTWLRSADDIVYARHTLNGHSGQGIEIIKFGTTTIPQAPVYTKGFNKTHEYRVHIINGVMVDFTKKRRRDGTESNAYIKNLSNGWVFCREGVACPTPVRLVGLSAIHALGLDFGAIDILYKESTGEARVLEVNTAPGLEGTTLQKYNNAFRNIVYDY